MQVAIETWEMVEETDKYYSRKTSTHDTNLVDPASSHTLVSKIKPCMCKYKQLTLKLRMAHYISYSLFDEEY